MQNIDISRLELQAERLDPNTRLGILDEFFEDNNPSIEEEKLLDDLDYDTFPLHARAWNLYTILLVTDLLDREEHENLHKLFLAHYNERKEDAKIILSSKPKYANFTDEQLDEKIEEIIAQETRNSFAHGNFKISYIKPKKLFFLLYPLKTEITSAKPIVVSADDLQHYFDKLLADNAQRIKMLLNRSMNIEPFLDKSIKMIGLPVQLIKFAEYYKDSFNFPKRDVVFDPGLYNYLQYAWMTAKITYEQDEYYDLFGKDSIIFNMISLVRNSVAHDNSFFSENASIMTHRDRDRGLEEKLSVNVTRLLVIDSLKSDLQSIIEKHGKDHPGVIDIKNNLTDLYNDLFNSDRPFEEVYEEYKKELG